MDKRGNSGKTWLGLYLWERGDCYYVPRSVSGSGKISADCCTNCGNAKYIIIDVQRDKKFPPDFYADIEELKDGLVSDPRYHGLQRNIRGRKLIIFTNKELDTKKLSADRWRLHSCHLHDLENELHEIKQKRRRNTVKIKIFQSNSTRNIRQTIIDTNNDTDLYRSTNEVTKCTEDTGTTDATTETGATTDAGATTDEVVL